MHRAIEAALLVASLGLGARGEASVQVEPVARLGLEGGYDSNVLYDGRGDAVARISPDLGVFMRDHTWNLRMAAGGDLLSYRNGDTTAWNQRGELALHSRFSERLALDTEAGGAYAFDPLGLARFGIFGRSDSALLLRGDARLAWRTERDWRLSGTFRERLVAFSDGTGSAGHTPGLEAVHQFDRRWEAGGAYRFDFFQGIGPGSFDATAQEVQGVARWRLSRRWRLEAEGGPVFWSGPTGQFVIPQAALRSYWHHARIGDARLSISHGVGLGYLAEPGLLDGIEGAITARLGRRWQLHVDGGIWRSGHIPWGADSTTGYGLQGELAYRLGGGVTVGVGGSRFARADLTTTQFDRTTLGLRFAWELQRRQERH